MTSLFKTPSAPAAPDPVQTANAQTASNEQTARTQAALNRINEVTPYGNVTYTNNGGDNYTRTTTLPADQQRALDSENALYADATDLARNQVGRISDALAQPFSYDGLPAAATADAATRQKVEDALYDKSTRYINQDSDQQLEQLRTRLANQGITQGSDAYNTEMDLFNRNRDAQLANARDTAIAQGGTEEANQFNMQNTARNQAISELVQQRSQPINEIAALLGTGQVQGYNAGSVPQVSVQPTDVIGANTLAYNGAMNTYNQQMASRNALIGALGSAAGTAGGLYAGR